MTIKLYKYNVCVFVRVCVCVADHARVDCKLVSLVIGAHQIIGRSSTSTYGTTDPSPQYSLHGSRSYVTRNKGIIMVSLALGALLAATGLAGASSTQTSSTRNSPPGEKHQSRSSTAAHHQPMRNWWDQTEYYAPYVVAPASHASSRLVMLVGLFSYLHKYSNVRSNPPP